MRARSICVLAVTGLFIFASTSTRADDGADIDLQAFRPAMDSKGFVTVEGPDVLGHGEIAFGLVTTWARGLLRFDSGERSFTIDDVLSPTLLGAVGWRPFGLELELGVALPVGVLSGDRGPDADGGTPDDPNDDRGFGFDAQGLGDITLAGKWRLRPGSRGGVGVAVLAELALPTATADRSFLGSGAVVPSLSLATDWRIGAVRLGANLGARLAPRRDFVDDGGGDASLPATGGVLRAGATLPFGVAAAYPIADRRFELVGEIYGAAPLRDGGSLPVEAVAGAKLYLADRSYLSFGAGAGLSPGEAGSADLRAFLGIVFEPRTGDRDRDGLRDDVDRCPDDPEDRDDFHDQDGCPDLDDDLDGVLDVEDACRLVPEDRDGVDDHDGCPEGGPIDRDGDDIVDDDDACPDEPEDLDGFEDGDGCPDLDDDGDTILDVDDLCREEPEDFDGWEDDDGCPERGPVTDVGTVIEVLEAIHFEYDSDVIAEESFAILRAVATTLKSSPDIRRVEIQGHTDERGSDAYNLDLSQRRAASVVRFLVAEGVDENVLSARGYGEREPKLRQRGEEAWAINRRVEFVILERTSDR